MKKKLLSWFQLLFLLMGIFMPSIAGTRVVEAKEVSGVITSMELTNYDGGELRAGYDIWQQFRIQATFALPDNTVKAGDTTTITLPNEIAFALTSSIELKDSKGNLVANAAIDEQAKTITLTYTDYAEKHSNVTGNFFFYGRVDHQVIQSEQDINIILDVQGTPVDAGRVHYNGPPGRYYSVLEKSGWQDKDDAKKLKYEISVNRNMEILENLVVSDKLVETGLEIIPDSFQVLRLDWAWDNGTWAHSNYENITSQLDIQISADKRSFSIDLGSLNSKGLLINYDVRLPYLPVDGEVFKNEARLTSKGAELATDLVATTYFVAGGSAEGYVYSIDISKTDEQGAPLKGAVFEVVRNRNGAVVARVTSDEIGRAVVNGLLKDDYTIREVTPPPGYKPLVADVQVAQSDFAEDKVALVSITNVKAESTTTTTTTTTSTTTSTATTTSTVEPTTTVTTTVEPTTTTATTTSTEEPTTTLQPTTTESTTSTVASTSSAPTTTTVTTSSAEPTTTIATTTAVPVTTTTTVEPSTTVLVTTSSAPTTTSVTTSQEVPTTDSSTPPSARKTKKTLPKTGEESGFGVALVGTILLVVTMLAVVYYQKSKNS